MLLIESTVLDVKSGLAYKMQVLSSVSFIYSGI